MLDSSLSDSNAAFDASKSRKQKPSTRQPVPLIDDISCFSAREFDNSNRITGAGKLLVRALKCALELVVDHAEQAVLVDVTRAHLQQNLGDPLQNAHIGVVGVVVVVVAAATSRSSFSSLVMFAAPFFAFFAFFFFVFFLLSSVAGGSGSDKPTTELAVETQMWFLSFELNGRS